MPVIELHSPAASPGPGALRALSSAVTGFLGIPDGQCWLLWRRLDPAEAYRPEWDGSRPPAPAGFVTCKASYTDEQVAGVLELLRTELARLTGSAADEVYLAVRRAAPGEVAVRGAIWRGDTVRAGASEPVRREAPEPVSARPVGRVVGGRTEVFDDNWGDVTALIRLDGERFGPEALYGLESFSHLEVVYHFDRVPPAKIESGARHPRGNTDWPRIGIFAQRGKNRPNRLGVSRCKLLKVDGLDVHVQGLDAVDGSPVLDIKPYMEEFGPRGETTQPSWSAEIMRDYY